MNITLSSKEIKNSLQAIVGVVEKKQTLPILSHVLFQIEDRQLTLFASDMETEIKARTTIKNAANVSFTVYAKTLIDIIRNLSDETQLTFSITDSQIILTIEGNQFTLNTLATKDFPKSPQISNTETTTVNKNQLKNLLDKTMASIASQDVRTYLSGLLIKLNNKELTLVATDGRRLAVAKQKQNSGLNKETAIIIHKKTVLELQKILTNELCGEEITIILSENYFIANAQDNIILTSRLVDAQFPDYEGVIPKNIDSAIIINRLSFLSCLQQAAIFIEENTKSVFLNFGKNKQLTINSQSEKGHADIKLTTKTDIKTPIEVEFNVYFLIHALEKLTTEDIHFVLPTTEEASCLLTNSDSLNTLYVFMPIRN